jgi:hypothetical protein
MSANIRNFLFIVTELGLLITVAVSFAIVHATAQLKLAREDQKDYEWLDFVINFTIPVGSGSLAGTLAYTVPWFNQQIAWIIFFTASGSIMGLTGLNRLGKLALNVLTSVLENFVKSTK